MKSKFTVEVGPTWEQGNTKFVADSRADALWEYNSMRAHDGLPPLKRMPKGTKYTRLVVRDVGYQPKTGDACHCKPGQHRDNCPDCEGTGMRIDFALLRSLKAGAQ